MENGRLHPIIEVVTFPSLLAIAAREEPRRAVTLKLLWLTQEDFLIGLASREALRQDFPVTQNKANAVSESAAATAAELETEILYLAKRHRVSPAIVREIIRRSGNSERGSVEREIEKGKARR
jgi:hypothetical protein